MQNMINEAQIKFLDEQIKESEEILASNDPQKAAEQILRIKRLYWGSRVFSTEVLYLNNEYAPNGYTPDFYTPINLNLLQDLIKELGLYRAQLLDQRDFYKQTQNYQGQIVNNVQVGQDNKVVDSNIGNNIGIKDSKEKSICKKIANFFTYIIRWIKG